MKTIALTLFTCVVTCQAALAQPGKLDYTPVRINQVVNASYPPGAVAAGLKNGVVSIAISVDEKGQLTDQLVTAYSHPSFAEEALKALRKWTFEPARIRGVGKGSKTDLTFYFEARGVAVVSLDALSAVEFVHYNLASRSDAYSACTLSLLDRIPTPTRIISPLYTNGVPGSTRGAHVRVEFYIDPEGHVRMPSVDQETIVANEELAAAAITAVSQWQFEPPTSKGRPVLVLAHQDFEFKPAASQGRSGSGP